MVCKSSTSPGLRIGSEEFLELFPESNQCRYMMIDGKCRVQL
jgi:hypothetical protein